MNVISVTQARKEMKNIVNRAVYSGERTYLTSYDKIVAVVIPIQEWDYIDKKIGGIEDILKTKQQEKCL